MKITCSQCRKTYQIPDERIPRGKEIVFPCPSCKSLIRIHLPADNSEAVPSAAKAPFGQEQPDTQNGQDLMKKILSAVEDLPPMPQIVLKAQEVMAKPNAGFKEIGAIIETDQAIAARVLRMANSSYYGLSGMVTSVHQASVVLGLKTLAELILLLGTSKLLDRELKGYGVDSGFLWKHSLAVAFGSKLIASKRMPKLENDSFSAGLIHDAGKLVLDTHISQKKPEFDALMQEGKKNFLDAEKEILGFDHSELTAELCRFWKIPENQTLAIRYHHEPLRMQEERKLANILHIADVIAIRSGYGTGESAALYPVQNAALDDLLFSEEDLDGIQNGVADYVEKISNDLAKA